ncbi:band 7 protein [Caenispirillum salinarum AK4]|uniref:Band 7 protein n=1 Tax=Caenispirillum salinarum AK4 TaxID=1238182 RepID=K9GX62_9PROT|nr:prohibitin family protein [Caenispirillum salinarum]EKV29837.1 band 7 protein [Caenispirillum salinarum AK4]
MTSEAPETSSATPESITAGTGAHRVSAPRRVLRWVRRHGLAFYLTLFVGILMVSAMGPSIFINVPAGHVGVLWKRFAGGTVTEIYYTEGLQVIWPWDEMYIYDVRLQNDARVYDVISADGLEMSVEIAVRYRVTRDSAGYLHKLIGPNYPEILVYPEIGSHARTLISRYSPEQLYTTKRAFIQKQILERMVTQLGESMLDQGLDDRLVQVEDVLIRSVRLPEPVRQAIEHKIQQYHVMLEYDYRLQREQKERARKQIEAAGIQAFQQTVSQGITPDYLRLRGIEATLALAQSPNSKIVIVGGGDDGLPIILGGLDQAPAATGRTGRTPAAALPGTGHPAQDSGIAASDFPAMVGNASHQPAPGGDATAGGATAGTASPRVARPTMEPRQDLAPTGPAGNVAPDRPAPSERPSTGADGRPTGDRPAAGAAPSAAVDASPAPPSGMPLR